MSDPLPPSTRDASAALVLGILGFATCGLLSPFAIYYGSRALNEIEDAGEPYTGARTARLGQLMGLIGTAMLVVGVALVLAAVAGLWDFLAN